MSNKEDMKIVNPSFPCLIYELEELIKEGWKVSQGVYMEPIYIAGLYEINLERGEDVVENTEQVEIDVKFAVEEEMFKSTQPTPLPTKEKVVFKAPKQQGRPAKAK